MTRLPVLLAGAALLVVGAVKLLGEQATSPAGAGALMGSGLTIVGAWVWQELRDREDR